jgi:hypothetical protein
MEELLEDFLEQLETFQKSFKSRMSKANHLFWAEAEECRILELLSECSKQNQHLQHQIDLILGINEADLKNDSDQLRIEIQGLNESIWKTCHEIQGLDGQISKKEEVIAELSARIEKINPPDFASIGLPNEWKYLEGKQIEYEIISPRFLNDSEDSLKDFNEVTVFSPSNKVKRNTCKSLDMQNNCFFDTEEFRRVYGKEKLQEGKKNEGMKDEGRNEREEWEEFKEEKNHLKSEEDEKRISDQLHEERQGVIIEYKEETQIEFEERNENNEEDLEVQGITELHLKKVENGLDVDRENKGDINDNAVISIVSKWEEWDEDLVKDKLTLDDNEKTSKVNLKILEQKEIQEEILNKNSTYSPKLKKNTLNTIEESQNLRKGLEHSISIETSGKIENFNNEMRIKESQENADDFEPAHKVKCFSSQSNEYSPDIQKNIKNDSPEKQPELFSPSETINPEGNTEEVKISVKSPTKEQPVVNSVKKEDPPKRFFKYQPRVIPKKIQAAKNQKDDFFDELL